MRASNGLREVVGGSWFKKSKLLLYDALPASSSIQTAYEQDIPAIGGKMFVGKMFGANGVRETSQSNNKDEIIVPKKAKKCRLYLEQC